MSAETIARADPGTPAPLPHPHTPAHPRAFALLVVLSVLALMVTLVVAILGAAQGARATAAAGQEIQAANTLVEAATSLVIGQIRSATSPPSPGAPPHPWASQPGAIRRYAPDGSLDLAYKLYSAASLTSSDPLFPSSDLPPPDWASATMAAHFVDLNAPVRSSTALHFPIIDPRAAGQVDGFDFDPDTVSGTVADGTASSSRLPMPVRWLYVLQDGTMGTLDPQGRFVGPSTPAATNPVVGRIAFWTDDESSKLNLNTAAEPTHWDTPRSTNQTDFLYGRFQPASHEFQRYPGHPSTTALSPVLFPHNTSPPPATKEQLYDLLPRVGPGGTASATRHATAPPRADAHRLFAAPDEFLFRPDRTTAPIQPPAGLAAARFFLTSHSRSPELTAFSTPRIAIWPLPAEGLPRTAFDSLIARCSTLGGVPWHFQRADPASATADYADIPRNQQLIDYLRALTSRPVPGYGSSLESRWTTGPISDRDQILTSIFDYIRSTNLNDISAGAAAFAPRGQVVPIQIPSLDTKGFGRFLTLSEVALHFICLGDGLEGGRGEQRPDGSPLAPDERLIQCSLLVEPFSISPGWVPLYEDIAVRIRGLESLGITGLPSSDDLRFSATPPDLNIIRSSYYTGWHGVPWGTSYGVRHPIGRLGNGYPFLSQKVVVKATGAAPTMPFRGGDLTIQLFARPIDQAAGPVQEIHVTFPPASFPIPRLVETGTGPYRGANATSKEWWWGFGGRYASTVWNRPHAPGPEYADPKRRWPPDNGNRPSGFMEGGVFRAEDVVRSLVPYHGDYRLVAAQALVDRRPDGSPVFVPHADYHNADRNIDHIISEAMGPHMVYGFNNEPALDPIPNSLGQLVPKPVPNPSDQLTPAPYHWSKLPDVPRGTGLLNLTGDFDNGVAQIQDGAYINKPDEGNMNSLNGYPYYHWAFAQGTPVHFSPSRILSSPIAFGSLPTGALRDRPWETLLFRRQPGHPGSEDPPDHVLLDLFWMPSVEPYAISEPFSTAGKVNLNHQLAPFSHITRDTALRAVLRSEQMMVVPSSAALTYKLFDHETSDWPWMPDVARGNLDPDALSGWIDLRDGRTAVRVPIEPDITLAQFTGHFASGSLFLSASEICDVHLVPDMSDTERADLQPTGGHPSSFNQDALDQQMASFWQAHVVNGDNTREKPYANLHGRVTTRSNTFRIHYHVQSIKLARSSDPAIIDPQAITVTSSLRGSRLVERFLDPASTGIPDYATAPSAPPLDTHYQFRILETTRLMPR